MTKSGSWRHASKANGPKPVRSMRWRCLARMIWSVSTSPRLSGIALPRTVLTGFIPTPSCRARLASLLHPLAHVHEVARDRRRRRHLRTDEVRPAAGALAALEVPIARAGAALARQQDVGVHAEAHRATGVAPLEACL